jgi:hypothetical protein
MSDDPFEGQGPARVEPSAVMLAAAREAREWYAALRTQGFTDGSACRIIGTMMGTAISGSGGED